MAPDGFDRRTALKGGLVAAAGATGFAAAPAAFGAPQEGMRAGRSAREPYVLPELDYDYAALEPHISAQINELHHSKHHAGYVKGANETMDKLAAARDADDFSNIVGLETTLAFNLAGHANHVVWWKILSPEGGGEPTGELAAAIDDSFGSFEKFKAHFTAVATTIQGNGWAALSWDPLGKVLVIQQLRDHHNNLILPTTPIMMVDVWEHAFYLQYQNVKDDYVAALWNVYNWDEIGRRFDEAVAASSTPGR